MTTQTEQKLNDVDIGAVGALVTAVAEDPDKGQTEWQATVNWTGAFRSEASIRDFDPIPSDEPAGLGGTDTAPNPVEQVLAALGNCLAVGYAANATAVGVEINDLRIELSGDVDLQTFLGLKPGHAGYGGLSVKVHLDSDATDEQLAALHDKVVNSSPVGHTLSNPVPLNIELA
ncbi:MAG: OsmC family protein [bacterium]|nr:OsmC family protein [bacterium]